MTSAQGQSGRTTISENRGTSGEEGTIWEDRSTSVPGFASSPAPADQENRLAAATAQSTANHAQPQPIVIGVAGGTGSGKTTVAHHILEKVGWSRIAFIQHDSYYYDASNLPLSARGKLNFDHPDALETPLLIEHLRILRGGQPVRIPVYDFRTHTRSQETRLINPEPVILVEGILIFAERALRDLFDVKIFVDADSDIRFIRRLVRDMKDRGRSLDSVVDQYMTTVRPMHLEFVEPSKRYADVIIPEGGHNQVALDMVVSRVQALLQSGKSANR